MTGRNDVGRDTPPWLCFSAPRAATRISCGVTSSIYVGWSNMPDLPFWQRGGFVLLNRDRTHSRSRLNNCRINIANTTLTNRALLVK